MRIFERLKNYGRSDPKLVVMHDGHISKLLPTVLSFVNILKSLQLQKYGSPEESVLCGA